MKACNSWQTHGNGMSMEPYAGSCLACIAQVFEKEHRCFAVLHEVGLETCKIAFPQPIRRPAGNPDLGGVHCEEFRDQFVDRIPISASSALLIKAVNEQRLMVAGLVWANAGFSPERAHMLTSPPIL
jgi:hypothetical protein